MAGVLSEIVAEASTTIGDKDRLERVYEVHRRSIHPAIRVYKEWGSLLLNEDVRVVCENQKATDRIGKFFSYTNFMAQAQATVVKAFGLALELGRCRRTSTSIRFASGISSRGW